MSRRVANIFVLLAWGYLALTLVYTGLLWLQGDAWWLATVLLFAPRWPALLPAPLLAMLVAFTRPRLLLPIGVATLVALGPAMGYRLGVRAWFTATRQPDLRVVTFNLDAFENTRRTNAPLALEAFRPDVIAFQECVEEVAQPEFWPAGWTARFDAGSEICIASRFPMLEVRTLPRLRTGEQGGTGAVVLFRVQSPAGPLDIAAIHLETPRKGLEPLRFGGDVSRVELNDLVRDVGSRRLRRWIAEQSKEIVIMGDFNMPVESTIYRAYWSDCPDAFSKVGHGFGWTRVLPHFSIRIDHVLTCGGWRSLRAWVGPDLGSDHRPLIVDLARKH